MKNIFKKGIGPVVSIALLLVIAVSSVFIFQVWLSDYFSKISSGIEIKSSNFPPEIEKVSSDILYIKSYEPQLNIKKILIDGKDCLTNITSNKTITEINISSCLNNLTIQNPQITLITSENVVTENVYLKDIIISNLENTTIAGPTIIETDGNFKLLSNGIVDCKDATVGESGTLNGITYIAVSNQNLSDKIESNDASFYETACTSLVTDMNLANFWTGGVFYNANINPNISHWDTSSVTDMSYMFSDASSFNQPLNWNTSSVTTMWSMFGFASSFNQPLNWDTSSVTDMSYMFYDAFDFNQPLNFDTSSVTYMSYMFKSATSFNQPLNWNTSSVTYMDGMFSYATSFNQNISQWCVTNINSKPNGFDTNSGFQGNSALQPQWGTCP